MVQLSRIIASSYLRHGMRAIIGLQPTASPGNHHSQSVVGSSPILSQTVNVAGSFASRIRHFSKKMSRPIVYHTEASPPSRAVRLAAAAIGLDVDVRHIDLLAGEHLKEEFLKLNPQHTVPTLDDNGVAIFDSHAIMCYLVDKYAKDDTLYPKDLHRRALINQYLFFESGVLFARLRFISFPLFMRKSSEVSAEKIELLEEAYVLLDKFLEGKQWLVGDSYTLADVSCVSTISSILCVHPIDDFPNIKAWLKRCEDNLPGYAEFNQPGCKLFHKAITGLITAKGKL